VRKLVQSRAFGRCEYCLLTQEDAGLPHEIDHVISRKHGGTSEAENLAFACYLCNRYKGATSPRSILELVSLYDYFTRARIVGQTIFASLVRS
jgi:5-methylcytosine-specific restriction endonuclease McrA